MTLKLCSSSLLMLMLMFSRAAQAQEIEKGNLVCLDSHAGCVQQLTAQAIANNEAVRVLDQAIKLNKTKLWTNYISANALNPFSLGLQLARNIAGGGDVAQAKLTTAQLRVQRLAIEDAMRAAITQRVTDYEAAQLHARTARGKSQSNAQAIELSEVSYRRGDSTTEAMIPLWQVREDLKAEILSAEADERRAVTLLREIVEPTRTPQPAQAKKP